MSYRDQWAVVGDWSAYSGVRSYHTKVLKLSDGSWGYTCPLSGCEDKLYGLKPDQNTAMNFARAHVHQHRGGSVPMAWREVGCKQWDDQ